jgi:beta-galactosidase
MKLSSTWALACLAAQAAGAAISHSFDGFTITEHPDPAKRALLQKYVCCVIVCFGWAVC